MDYFYNDESGKRAGPIPENAIHALFSGGLINGTTQVAAADTGNWMSYDSAFGIIDGPVPPAPSKLPPVLATSRTHVNLPAESVQAGSSWRVPASVFAIAMLATVVAYAVFHTPFSSLGKLSAPTAPPPAPVEQAKALLREIVINNPAVAPAPPVPQTPPAPIAAPPIQPAAVPAAPVVAVQIPAVPVVEAKVPAPPDDKADTQAEWYDFGFHQGRETRRIFRVLGRTAEPAKMQLVQLFNNLQLDPGSVSADDMNTCFDGYKDGWRDAKPSRLVAASQKRSTLPSKLRGYNKFAGDGNEVSASNEALEHALSSTVMVINIGSDGTSQGSGFFVGPGVLVTNRHVVEGGKVFYVRMPDRSVVVGSLIAADKSMDVALMSIPTKEHPVLRIADERTVRVGDNVTAVGFPESDGIARLTGSSAIWPVMREMEATSTFGRISARNRQVGKNDCFQVDMTINHGNSGGPTLDSEGRVVAISTFGLGEGDRINFVIKMTAVMHFINEHCDFPIEVEK